MFFVRIKGLVKKRNDVISLLFFFYEGIFALSSYMKMRSINARIFCGSFSILCASLISSSVIVTSSFIPIALTCHAFF